MAMGFCDKKLYEHSGPHNRIADTGQMLPPFGCVNWHQIPRDDDDVKSASVEAYWQAKQGEEYGSY